MQAQFLPDTVIYWYEIETLCKLDHTLLRVNETSNLFIKSYCKSKNKIDSYEARSNYINLK